ncbi:MAG: DUF6049 family protein, partial [Acidimicrobiales bacterium]
AAAPASAAARSAHAKSTPAPATAVPRHSGGKLVLDGQTEWVVPPASGSAAAFDLDVRAPRAPAGATVEAAVYPRLESRDAFKSAVRNGPHGYPISRTVPAAYGRLPAGSGGAGRALDLSVVTTARTDSRTAVGLDCAPPTGPGTCTGVYPVRVELVRPDGGLLAQLTTFLTFVAGTSAHPLDVAWVVPVQAPVRIDTRTSEPTRAVDPVSPGAAGALETLVGQLDAASGVPVTLDTSPETLQSLDARGTRGQRAVATLAAMSADQARDEVLPASYVPVALGALAGAGEPTEIVAQKAAGSTALHKLGVRTTARASWVATDDVGSDLLGGLRRFGAGSVVVPDTDLSATPVTSGTWASTFRLQLGTTATRSTSVPAAESDTWLDGQFDADPADPVLAASQMLADLAMVHFERPNTDAVRGLVAVPPEGWTADAAFDRVLLAGLNGAPLLEPVTLSTFLTNVTPRGARSLATSERGPVLGHGTAVKMSAARVRLTGFTSAIVGTPSVDTQLDELLLATETATLTARARTEALGEFETVLGHQMAQITVNTDDFTLTARTGFIPVTIDSSAPYAVMGTVSVSGSKFEFPRRSSEPTFTLDHPTSSWRVDVEARSSGDLPLHVTFTTPQGSLVIASSTLTVLSTSTTPVGVALTVAAVVILFAWWGRSWWNGRKRKRAGATGGARRGGAP